MMSASYAVAPSARTTRALTVSPHFSCGTPMTATSATAGWLKIVSSTSIDDTFSPPVMITSFLRSEIVRCPSASSSAPPSPVRNQPSSRTAEVSSGLSQYPSSTAFDRARTSPDPEIFSPVPSAGSPARESLRARSSAGRSSSPGRVRLKVSSGDVSVRP